MDFWNPVLDQSDVAVDFGEMGVDARDLPGEPLTVLERNEPVMPAVPQLQRHLDRIEAEAPGLEHRHAVIPPSLVTEREREVIAPDEPFRQLRLECGPVDIRQ